jgi:molybdopterin molybdotransferase
MISVSEATSRVLENLYKPTVQTRPLTEALGCILAEPVRADRDAPPFDRVTMDGIAIAYQQFQNGQRDFKITGVQAAGEPRKKLAGPDQAVEVMTGAVLPEGTDTVIRYEDLKIEDSSARIVIEKIQQFQSVHRKGIDAKANDVLLEPGTRLTPAEIALLASVGKSNVGVFTFPTAVVASSGDELVEISDTPLAHQIRRSNSYAIQSAMQSLGWVANQVHLPDEKTVLKGSLEHLIQSHDVLILSGGVSQGKFDFIPAVLEELGVRKVFHQVSQRPGKPFWFGEMDNARKVVFALPGNPVSTFMCFYRFIKPWLLKSLGATEPALEAVLAQDFSFTPALTYFLQVNVVNESGRMVAYPYAGGGSGDFINLKKVTGFLELPKERSDFKAGESFPYIPFRL